MGTPARAVYGRNREYEPPDECQLLDDLSGLITPPRVCLKLFELVRSSRASADEIAGVVALDPNLTARLLRIVNSSFFGFPSQVESVARAVTILGVRDLNNLVLAISAARCFAKVGDGLVRMEVFWKHSVFCGLLARQIARHYKVRDPDRLFVAGLLHELGSCVIYSQIPQLGQQMQTALDIGETTLYTAELEYLGYSHASVGARILEQWQLPLTLCDAVGHHHHPEKATEGRVEAALVHVADAFAAQHELGRLSGQPGLELEVSPSAWEILGGPPAPETLKQMLETVCEQFAMTLQNLVPRGIHS